MIPGREECLKISENQGSVIKVPKNSPFGDVIASLVSMGYDKKNVDQKIAELVEILSSSPDFESKSQKDKEDIIFRKAVVELS